MTFQQFKDKYQDYLVTVRRRFHESPELSMEEKETSRFIVAEVEACGLPYAVSYTHLDVYKRQPPRRPRKRSSG